MRTCVNGGGHLWARRLRMCGGALLDILYPRNCVVCAAPAAQREGGPRFLCEKCAVDFAPFEGCYCKTCGLPLPGLMVCPKACANCIESGPVFEAGRTAGIMRGPLRALIHALKYRGAHRVLGDLMGLCEQTPGYLEFLKGAVLVPVPLHPSRLRQRGYNQSERIACALAERAEGVVVRELLKRVRKTVSQTQLDARRRRLNMADAFAPIPQRNYADFQRVHVLIDDVFTTGSTLNAAAIALRRMGVKTVRIATLAHG